MIVERRKDRATARFIVIPFWIRRRLVDNWRFILNTSNTVKASIAASFFEILDIIEKVSPFLSAFLPEKIFSIVSIVIVVTIPIIRIFAQKNE